MDIINALLLLTFTHTVADFGLQTQWQAENKSKSLEALSRHVLSYTLAMAGGYAVLCTFTNFELYMLPLFIVWVGVSHFLTDLITSKMSSAAWKRKKIKRFWCVIGIDQMLHTWQIFGIIGLCI